MQRMGHCSDRMAQELRGCHLAGCGMDFGGREPGRPVGGHEAVERALGCLHVRGVDMEAADGIAFEPFLDRLVVLGLRQARDAVALEAAAQRRTRQGRQRGLQRGRGSRPAAAGCACDRR